MDYFCHEWKMEADEDDLRWCSYLNENLCPACYQRALRYEAAATGEEYDY